MHQLMRLFTLVAFAAILVLTSCQQDATVQTASDGTEFMIQKSTGSPKIQPGQYVYYHAQRRKGEEVESRSRDLGDPQIFQVPVEKDPNSGTALLEDVLTAMGVGDSATIILRLDTLPTKPPGFENEEVMYFDLVVTDVKDEAEFQAEQEVMRAEAEAAAAEVRERAAAVIQETKDVVSQYVAGTLGDQVKRTGSGLGYMITEEGSGTSPAAGRQVAVQYVGTLTDGTVFDNSFERGDPITFPLGVGRVIPGWDEGIALLKEGGNGYLFIPHQLGYGEAGSPPVIPANAELVFYVELIKVY
jgi:FKBP-type peptidyl-prolyl cis-trans isomerase FkpA